MKKHVLMASVAAATLLSFSATAQKMVALTNSNQIFVVNNVSSPTLAGSNLAITGMASGQSMVGIDYRPATGQLYGLGYNASTNAAQLYTIDATSGLATAIGSPVTLMLGSGISISIDFNPTVDRIRVVGENGANYRLHPTTGAIAATDVNLAFALTDVNTGVTPHIGAIGYTNSYVGASTTTLYNYDEVLNTLTTQIPPNAGTLNTVGTSGIALNVANSTAGMDIYMDPVTLTNTAYLSANTTGNNDMLYSVNLSTGLATQIGLIGSGADVKDIAIEIDRAMPSLSGQLMVALQKGTNNMFSFDSDNPRFVRSFMAITGTTAGQAIVGMDFRPATLELYALGYNETTTEYQVYTIDMATGAATAVGAAGTLALGAGGNIGFDFNPAADRIRVVSSVTNKSFRLDPATGAVAATDMDLAYATGDANFGVEPNIGSVGYTNSYKGATSTTLFGIDDSLAAIVTITPPNDGKLNTMASGFLALNLSDRTSDIDFFYDSTSSSDIGYMCFNTGTAVNDQLYRYTIAGGLTLVNDIGLGITTSDIAAQPKFRNALSVSSLNQAQKTIAIYPNPATNILQISAANISGGKAVIMDMTGKVLQTTILSSNTISIQSLPAGMYILKLNTDNDSYTPKTFIKE